MIRCSSHQDDAPTPARRDPLGARITDESEAMNHVQATTATHAGGHGRGSRLLRRQEDSGGTGGGRGSGRAAGRGRDAASRGTGRGRDEQRHDRSTRQARAATRAGSSDRRRVRRAEAEASGEHMSTPTHSGDGLTLGPVQMLVVGFEGDNFSGEIREELERLKEHDIVRLIDLLLVKKNDDGEIEVLQTSDLDQDEAEEFGAIGEEEAERGAIAGAAELEDGHVFDDDAVWYLSDAIPDGTAAAVALLEHRWAIPLRDKIARAGGVTLSDAWVHAADLVAIGLVGAAAKDAAGVDA